MTWPLLLRTRLERHLLAVWYAGQPANLLLRALACGYSLLVTVRNWSYRSRLRRAVHPGPPVVVVGNLIVGGSGKTPVVVSLVEALRLSGMRVGVLSRGYGARPARWPHQVTSGDDASVAGDEPLLIQRRTQVPVVVDPDRPRGAAELARLGVEVIVTDDGLQHLRLARDYELVVVDGERGFGNGRLIPAGPLREPLERLETVDAVLVNGAGRVPDLLARPHPPQWSLEVAPVALVNLMTGEEVAPAAPEPGTSVQAIAGIGHPQRFADTLAQLGWAPQLRAFSDHHRFQAVDIPSGRVLMTEKDAVKCVDFAHADCWYLKVDAPIPTGVLDALLSRLRETTGSNPPPSPTPGGVS
ncbi:MAG: tetraacyldisaccharide 4'-kinase [Pseudomonadota bacterium]|nr:tetraacyldisaccharide 4'-kinase [Pseudomonadota bacterium]